MELNTVENLLYIIREDGQYTSLETEFFDLALVLYAEYGGGNNSKFTTHIVTFSGTDTYSAISVALGCLKSPCYGGVNIKVIQMSDGMKANINIKDKNEVKDYLVRILVKFLKRTLRCV